MDLKQLKAAAQALVGNSKGILAADESGSTIEPRCDLIDTESTCVGGVILFGETIPQTSGDGVRCAGHLADRGMAPGTKAVQEAFFKRATLHSRAHDGNCDAALGAAG